MKITIDFDESSSEQITDTIRLLQHLLRPKIRKPYKTRELNLHETQARILELAKRRNVEKLTFREIARLINASSDHPNNIRHHIIQLRRKGLL